MASEEINSIEKMEQSILSSCSQRHRSWSCCCVVLDKIRYGKSKSFSDSRRNEEENTIEIDHDTTIVWYVSTKDGRRKLRVTTHDDESSIFLDCASDKGGSILTMWHDSISMAIRAAIECKSVKDSHDGKVCELRSSHTDGQDRSTFVDL